MKGIMCLMVLFNLILIHGLDITFVVIEICENFLFCFVTESFDE